MNDYALIKPKKMLLAIDTHYFLGYKVSSSWIVIFILELKKKGTTADRIFVVKDGTKAHILETKQRQASL